MNHITRATWYLLIPISMCLYHIYISFAVNDLRVRERESFSSYFWSLLKEDWCCYFLCFVDWLINFLPGCSNSVDSSSVLWLVRIPSCLNGWLLHLIVCRWGELMKSLCAHTETHNCGLYLLPLEFHLLMMCGREPSLNMLTISSLIKNTEKADFLNWFGLILFFTIFQQKYVSILLFMIDLFRGCNW